MRLRRARRVGRGYRWCLQGNRQRIAGSERKAHVHLDFHGTGDFCLNRALAVPFPRTWALTAALLMLGACSLLGDSGNGAAASGGKAGGAAVSGGKAGGGPGGESRAPVVVVGAVEKVELVDRIDAVGTAYANEQADLNSTVTERIARVNFGDGAFVPRGAVIAELVRTQQGASLNESQARLTQAQQRLDRLQSLQKEGFATRAQVEEAEAAVNVARAQSTSAAGQIGDRVVRAPFSGWLSLRRISPGAVVNAGTTIATIVDYSRIKLDFPVPEVFIAAVESGLAIEAKAAAFPGEIFRGKVATVDPLVDPVTRSVMVRALLPNPDLRLRPGMLMTVELQSAPRQALVVPELAVVGQGAQSFVFRLDEENVAERRPVTIGQRREGRVEIISGLAEGDRIVAEGTVKVREGAAVRPAGRPGEAAREDRA
jgi:membrane fusion protein (multidrug efflux system)